MSLRHKQPFGFLSLSWFLPIRKATDHLQAIGPVLRLQNLNVIMLLCYYVITKKIFPFNYSLQQHHATLYVYETYNKCNNTESSSPPIRW